MKILAIAALTLPLLAEDTAPTIEQLQSQLAAKDQQIAQLQQRLEQTADAYQGCVTIRAQMIQQRPALNPAQQRMMERGVKPPETPAKPEDKKR